MKKETKLRLDIKFVEDVQKKSNDVGDQIIAGILHKDLCQKFIDEKYPQPKEL
jgi:hypothetical protein